MTTTSYDPRAEYYTVPHPDFPAKVICRGFYQNTGNNVQIALVASIDLDVGDFAVYLGGTHDAYREFETLVAAARSGNKSERLARLYFADLFEHYRWRE